MKINLKIIGGFLWLNRLLSIGKNFERKKTKMSKA